MIVQIVPLSAAPNGPSVTGSKLRANLSTPPRFGVAAIDACAAARPQAAKQRAGGRDREAEGERSPQERPAVDLALEERLSEFFSSYIAVALLARGGAVRSLRCPVLRVLGRLSGRFVARPARRVRAQ